MRKLFAIMPFGRKRADNGHGREELDFDEVYRSLIRPAGEEAGWEVVRIDEVVTAGQISDQYLGLIFSADLVIADISLPNGNVYYELGIRQAISTGGTVLIAHAGTQLPFDIAGQRVTFYSLDPDGMALPAVRLTQALREYVPSAFGNPIRGFLEKLGAASNPRLDEAAFERDFHARIERASGVDQLVAVWQWARQLSPLPPRPLLTLARRLSEVKDWETSIEVLRAAADLARDDFEIHRQLGWHLRNLDPPQETEAMAELERALQLNPFDPETLGMLGGLLKRQKRYREAAASYARGAVISPNSSYMLVNQAAMAILSEPEDPAPGIALYQRLLDRLSGDATQAADAWAELVLGEASFAIGDQPGARSHYESALRLTASPNALRSAADQLELLGNVGFRKEEAVDLASRLRRSSSNALSKRVAASEPAARAALPVIIHLSDVHFGYRQKDGKKVDMHRFAGDGEYSKPLSKHLAAEFASMRRAHFKHQPERLYLVVSGDLTYSAERDEFDRVATFLTEVCEALHIGKDRVFLVPGNHDVHWGLAKVDVSHRFDNYLRFLRRFFGPEIFKARYPRLPPQQIADDERPKPSDILAIHMAPGLSLVGLNSCIYETDQNHYGFIGRAQLDMAEELLEDHEAGKDAVRIAVMHHHVHPFPEPLAGGKADEQIWEDVSTVRDAGLVERRLEKLGFDLVLHGHKHQAQLRETLVRNRNENGGAPGRLIVCGAGSTGVNASELGHNDSNHYEVIELLRVPRQAGVDFVRVEWRELALRNDAEWATSEHWTIAG